MKKKYLITGCCGFIGFSLANELLKNKNNKIFGIDNLNNYYSVSYKKKRLKILKKNKNFIFIKIDINKKTQVKKKLKLLNFDYVYHFAAQPGVRYSLVNPKIYYQTNVKGFNNLVINLNFKYIKKFIYASSSSVYGEQKKFPTNEKAKLNAKNPYGKTKIKNEYQAKIFEKIYRKPFIGIRFFTVYGEWGRPDMFILKLLDCIKKNKIFYLNNSGNHLRDFTYIEDVIKVLKKIIFAKLPKDERIFNVCASSPIGIKILIKEIQKYFPTIKIKNIARNNADVKDTFGSNKKIVNILGIKKFTNYKIGLKKTIKWYTQNFL